MTTLLWRAFLVLLVVRQSIVAWVNSILGTYCKGVVDKNGDKILAGKNRSFVSVCDRMARNKKMSRRISSPFHWCVVAYFAYLSPSFSTLPSQPAQPASRDGWMDGWMDGWSLKQVTASQSVSHTRLSWHQKIAAQKKERRVKSIFFLKIYCTCQWHMRTPSPSLLRLKIEVIFHQPGIIEAAFIKAATCFEPS